MLKAEIEKHLEIHRFNIPAALFLYIGLIVLRCYLKKGPWKHQIYDRDY